MPNLGERSRQRTWFCWCTIGNFCSWRRLFFWFCPLSNRCIRKEREVDRQWWSWKADRLRCPRPIYRPFRRSSGWSILMGLGWGRCPLGTAACPAWQWQYRYPRRCIFRSNPQTHFLVSNRGGLWVYCAVLSAVRWYSIDEDYKKWYLVL